MHLEETNVSEDYPGNLKYCLSIDVSAACGALGIYLLH